jgi:hypothetical protein
MDRGEKRPRHYGVVLSPEKATDIYAYKIGLLSKRYSSTAADSSHLLKGQSVPVGKKFNVSAKTVRDIWNRRTWTFATSNLWHEEDLTSGIVSVSDMKGEFENYDHCQRNLEPLLSSDAPSQKDHLDEIGQTVFIPFKERCDDISSNPLLLSRRSATHRVRHWSSEKPDRPSSTTLHVSGLNNDFGPIAANEPDEDSFMSILHDKSFLPSSNTSSEPLEHLVALDPFRADWPHWND